MPRRYATGLTGLQRLAIRPREARARTNQKWRITMTKDQQSTTSKKPAYIAYHVRDREGGEAFWTRIGSAWPHSDGKGFNIQVEIVPLDGRISLRLPSEKSE
ncbi:MAG: hypothetical protein QM796_20575 [Chthoniobacteraceae bacterium]